MYKRTAYILDELVTVAWVRSQFRQRKKDRSPRRISHILWFCLPETGWSIRHWGVLYRSCHPTTYTLQSVKRQAQPYTCNLYGEDYGKDVVKGPQTKLGAEAEGEGH